MGIFASACRHCGSKEHASEDCPHGIFSTECRHCGSKNHASDNCPHTIFSTECRHCHSKDHASDECPHSIFSTECRHCHSKNHASDACPHSIFSTKCRHCGSRDHATRNCPQGPLAINHHEASPSIDLDDSNGEGGLVKLLVGIGVVVFAIWFITSVAIPLLVINVASIALLIGAIKKDWSKFLFPVSILGAIVVLADYNRGWATETLVGNVGFFRSWIKPLLYVNLLAGLIAAYLLIRRVTNSRLLLAAGASELSKRNLVVMGCLLVVGATIISVQQYVDTSIRHLPVATNDRVQSPPTNSVAFESSRIKNLTTPNEPFANDTVQAPSLGVATTTPSASPVPPPTATSPAPPQTSLGASPATTTTSPFVAPDVTAPVAIEKIESEPKPKMTTAMVLGRPTTTVAGGDVVAGILADGESCMEKKKFDCAIASAKSALRLSPANVDAQTLLKRAESSQKHALDSILLQ